MVSVWSKDSIAASQLSLFPKRIAEASDGRLTIKLYHAGELVPPPKAIEAVGGDTAEMGYAVPAFWARKVPAAMFLCMVPFGLTAQEQNAWFEYGGGQAIADKVYAELGCKFFRGGNTGAQMGGWFNKEINSISDLKGLKIRISGPGGAVLKAAGAEVVPLPLGKTAQALKNGEIDAAERVGPAPDMAAGMHKLAKYYYYPCWHEPGAVFDLFINRTKWDALPSSLKAVIEATAMWLNYSTLSNFVARNSAALATLVKEYGVQLRQFPDKVLQELGRLSEQMLRERASKDKLSEEVLDSIMSFRKKASGWSAVSLQPYLAARAAVL